MAGQRDGKVEGGEGRSWTGGVCTEGASRGRGIKSCQYGTDNLKEECSMSSNNPEDCERKYRVGNILDELWY